MSKYCQNPQCSCYKNVPFPDIMSECPVCHTAFETPRPSSGFNLNLGDANAISGGVNMSDNHSVSNNSVSNVDSHNVITNNITQVEREKTPEELKHERELEFRKACQEAYANGILTNESKIKLEDIKHALNIEDQDAFRIIADVSNQIKKKYDKLTPRHQSALRNTKTAIENNRLDMIERLLPDLRIMSKLYSDNEVQFYYYMLLAVLHPDRCVEEFSKQIEDVYWQTFWASLAFLRLSNSDKSAQLAASLDIKWAGSLDGNGRILDATKYLLSGERDFAKDRLEEVGDFDVELNSLRNCLTVLLDSESLGPEDLKMAQEDGSFYLKNLFAGFKEHENERACQQEGKRQRQEAENHRFAGEVRLKNVDDKKIATTGQPNAHAYILERDSAPKDEDLTAEQLLVKALTVEGPDRIPLLKKASEKGSAEAMYRLACRYLKGDWVEKDLYKSFSYMQRAAQANHVKAMANLGVMYKRGLGTKANGNRAIEWLRKAAIQKDEQATALLSAMGIVLVENNANKNTTKEGSRDSVHATNEPTAKVKKVWVTQDNKYGFVLNLTLEFRNVKRCKLECSIDTSKSSDKYNEKDFLFKNSFLLSMSTTNDTIDYQIPLLLREIKDNLKYNPDVLTGIVANFEIKTSTQVLTRHIHTFNVLYVWHMFSDSEIFLK